MVDFLAWGMSPLLFLSYAKTYLQFRQLVESHDTPILDAVYLKSLEFFSVVVARGIRIQEIHIIEMVMDNPSGVRQDDVKRTCRERYGFVPSDRSMQSALRILENGFFKMRCAPNSVQSPTSRMMGSSFGPARRSGACSKTKPTETS